jgi:Flp pilus assembly protein TadB
LLAESCIANTNQQQQTATATNSNSNRNNQSTRNTTNESNTDSHLRCFVRGQLLRKHRHHPTTAGVTTATAPLTLTLTVVVVVVVAVGGGFYISSSLSIFLIVFRSGQALFQLAYFALRRRRRLQCLCFELVNATT